MALGRVGVWTIGLRGDDEPPDEAIPSAAAELERLGYDGIWLGGSPGVRHAGRIVRATAQVTVATGILNIWTYGAAEVASEFAELDATHPGRFLLGLGAGHAALVSQYQRPYSTMVEFLDGLDAAETPVAANRRVLAALGPRMLRLSADRAAGAHPYLVTADYVAHAREILGAGALLAPEVKIVFESDQTAARAKARAHLATYLRMPNYTGNLLRSGFTEDDFADGGSDRLVDAVFIWGTPERVRERVDAFHQAGADEVVAQVITSTRDEIPLEGWRRLADVLELTPRPALS